MDLKPFAEKLVRYRAWVAVGVLTMTALAGIGLVNLGFDDNPRDVFRRDDEDFRLLEEVFDQFGTDEHTCFLIVQSENLFSQASIEDLRRLVEEVRVAKGIESVVSLTDERFSVFEVSPSLLVPLPQWRPLIPPKSSNPSDADLQEAKQDAMKHPLVAGHLLSEDDGNHALVTVQLAGEALSIAEIQPVHDSLVAIAKEFTKESSLEVIVTGIPAIRAEAFHVVRQESRRFTILCAIASFAMAVVILRCWQMVVVVCTAAMTGAMWSVGTLGLIGEDITVLTVVLPMLVMVVAFTDSIHLVVDVRHSRVAGLSPRLAVRDAVRHLTAACALTSFTTAIGFASLGVTQTEIIRRFGLACGMGAVLTFFAVITIVPLLTSTWLGKGMLAPRHGKRLDAIASAGGKWVIEIVLRWRWMVVIVAIVLAVVMTFAALQLKPENEITESLPDNSPAIRALDLVDKHFGGMLPSFVVVDWPDGVEVSSAEFRNALGDVHQTCELSPAVNHPFSIISFFEAAPFDEVSFLPDDIVRKFVRKELRRAVVLCRSPARGTSYYAREYPKLAKELGNLKKKHPGFQFRLTGSSVVASKNLDQMITDLASSLGLATIVIFVTLTVVFRSLRIGLICLIPNALPLLFTAALLVLMGESLRFSSVIVFCVCLGIAVDDTIHVVNRFQRELLAVGDIDEALRRSFKAVGSALLITTIVLVVGFSITLTSAMPGNRMFGSLACIAIVAALIGDLIVLPAMLACFAKRPKRTVD